MKRMDTDRMPRRKFERRDNVRRKVGDPETDVGNKWSIKERGRACEEV